MAEYITIHSAPGKWVVRTAGAVLAETTNALELTEGTYGPVIYFPREDIGMAFLDVSATTSHCPRKGDATYYSIVTKAGVIEDAGWSYEAPIADMEQIKGYIAFYTDKVNVEQL